MQASDRSDLISTTPEQRRAAGSFVLAIGAMAMTIAIASMALRASVRETTVDMRFPTHYSAGASMPFPVIMDHEHGWTFLVVFFVFVAVMAIMSLLAGRALGRSGRSAPGLLLIGLVVVLAFMTSFPVTFSLDSYAYAAFGRLLGVHGLNPYVERLANGSPPGDPVLASLTSFLGTPLPDENYGPLWTWLSAGLAIVAQPGGLPLLIWVQRAAGAAALVLATCGALALQRNAQPAQSARRAALFALHPLALYESAAAGHNDILMIAPAVWAFAVADSSPLLAGVLIGASIAVKYVALLALPFLLIQTYRRFGAAAALHVALPAIGLPVVLFAPLWPGWAALGTLLNLGSTLIMSPQWLASMWLPFVSGRVLSLGFATAFAIVLGYSIVRYALSQRCDHVFRAVAALLWSSPLLNPWYVQWLLPAAAATGRLARYAWWFGLIVLLRYVEDALRFPSTQSEVAQRIFLLEWLTGIIVVVPVALSFAPNPWFQRIASDDA